MGGGGVNFHNMPLLFVSLTIVYSGKGTGGTTTAIAVYLNIGKKNHTGAQPYFLAVDGGSARSRIATVCKSSERDQICR